MIRMGAALHGNSWHLLCCKITARSCLSVEPSQPQASSTSLLDDEPSLVEPNLFKARFGLA